MVFEHPLGEDWIDYEVGDRLEFSGPNSTAIYETVAVEDLRNQDALSLVGGDSNLGCRLLRRTVLQELEAEDLRLELYLSQLEFADRQPEEEPLSLQVDARLSEQNIAVNLGFVTLAPGSDSNASVGEGSIVRRNETLGSRTYDLTLLLGVEPDTNEAYLNVPNRIESLSLAEGFGVVAIERTDVGPLYLDEVIRAAPDR